MLLYMCQYVCPGITVGASRLAQARRLLLTGTRRAAAALLHS